MRFKDLYVNDYSKIYFLNTPYLNVEGEFKFEKTTYENILNLIKNAESINSAIGHEETANLLSTLFGVNIEMNRIDYKQNIDELAIVFKLNSRQPEGKIIKSIDELEKIGYEFYLLKRLR